MSLNLDTEALKSRLVQGEVSPDALLDPSKVEGALRDPSSTFLQFVSLYYSLMSGVIDLRGKMGLKALSMLPGGFSPKEQTAAGLLNNDRPGAIDSMTSLDADRPTLERLRQLFRNRLGEASFLDHLVGGYAENMPFLDETFDLGIMNHGIDDILTAAALRELSGVHFEYHPPVERQAAHAKACRQVGKVVQARLSDGSRNVLSVVQNAVAKLVPGGVFALTNYPSHHFAQYDRLPEGEGYFNDITGATDACFADAMEWAETDPSVCVQACTVTPFLLGFSHAGEEKRFTSQNIGVIQKV